MSWLEIKISYQKLVNALNDGSDLSLRWSEFVSEVSKYPPPYHLLLLIKKLESLSVDRDRGELIILDHGCGGGLTLMYLAAIGYRNIYGVDLLTSNCERWNLLTSEVFGFTNKRYFAYDGVDLPVEDGSVDVVFSQQVLEHVSPHVLNNYYSEEARVLRIGGLALHSVPHRLVPYESHTRTWFLHYFLPRNVWLNVLNFLGKNNATAQEALFLRWPGEHEKMAKRYFGNCQNVTKDRLRALTNFEYYDGSVRLRMLIAKMISLPFIGNSFCALISRFMMIDTISIKTSSFR